MTHCKSIFSFATGVFLFFCATQIQAQSMQIHAGVNLEAAFPLGDFGKAHSFGFGGDLMGRYGLSDKAMLTASIGYLHFPGKTITETFIGEDGEMETETYKIPDMNGVPLRLGANYLIAQPLFIEAQLGAAFLKGGTAFLFTPGIGARFGDLEIAAKYEGWSKAGTLSFMGVRVGYFF